MMFTITNANDPTPHTYNEPRDVIDAFHAIQYAAMDYTTFFRAFKRRLRIFTGRSEVTFYDEARTVKLLESLGEIKFLRGA